jgi:hypothetical protein
MTRANVATSAIGSPTRAGTSYPGSHAKSSACFAWKAVFIVLHAAERTLHPELSLAMMEALANVNGNFPSGLIAATLHALASSVNDAYDEVLSEPRVMSRWSSAPSRCSAPWRR